ncbi:MAG TPA: secretin and TonB N-terminal domain-containing protein, partial [Burkholderiales bacterium]|nr:secretin and TonB N-terminal domain-containing protein [Burkholderiales bacterium]
TLEFRDANVKMVFDVLARTSGINFIFDKDVKADTKVTIYVRNVAVEDAIDLLLIQSQLEKKVMSDNSVLIYPNTPQKLKEYQDLVIRSFYLGNGDAKQTLNLIKTIIKTKDVYVDERLNLLVMRDTPEAIRLAEKLINAQDMAEPEVLLEVEVLEINRAKTLEMGITWPSTFTVLPSGSVLLSDMPFGPGHSLDTTDVQINTNLIAKLRQDSTVSNLLSNPRIRVRNREKARVLVGTREPVVSSQVTPGSTNPIVTESVQYLDVGLKFEIEPTVLMEDEVSMKVSLEVSAVTNRSTSPQGTSLITVGTRNVNTALRLKDGETAVMMGFIRDDSTDGATGIPGLMDLPLLSRLFSSGTTAHTKNEIVFSVTPRVVRNLKHTEASATEFWSGTEGALRTKPPILQSALSGAAAPPAAPAAPAGAGVRPAPVIGAAPQPAAPGAQSLGAEAQRPAAAPEAPAPGPVAAAAPPAEAAPPPAPAGPLQPVKLSWIGPASSKVGDEIKVSVMANSPDPLLGAGMVFKFDPSNLQVVKVEEGTFLKQGGVQTTFTESVSGPAGRVVANVRRESGTGAQGEGPLLTITFKVVGKNPNSQILLLSFSPTTTGSAGMRFTASGPHSIALN